MSSSGTLSNYYVDSLIGHEGDEVFAARFGPPGPGAQGRPAGVADSPAAAAEFASCSFAPKSAVFSASWSAVPAQPPAAAMSGLYHPYVPPPPLAAAASEPSRYMRSWMEPLPGFPGGAGGGGGSGGGGGQGPGPSPGSSGPPNRRHYGIKPETGAAPTPAAAAATSTSSSTSSSSSSKQTECSAARESQGSGGPEFSCNSFLRDKAAAAATGGTRPGTGIGAGAGTGGSSEPSACSDHPSPGCPLKEEEKQHPQPPQQQLDPSKCKRNCPLIYCRNL